MVIKNKERKGDLTGLTVPEGGKEDQVVPMNQRIETSSIDNGIPKFTKEKKVFIKNKERKEYLTGLTVHEGGTEDQVDPIKELKHLALTMVSPNLRRRKRCLSKTKKGRNN